MTLRKRICAVLTALVMAASLLAVTAKPASADHYEFLRWEWVTYEVEYRVRVGTRTETYEAREVIWGIYQVVERTREVPVYETRTVPRARRVCAQWELRRCYNQLVTPLLPGSGGAALYNSITQC